MVKLQYRIAKIVEDGVSTKLYTLESVNGTSITFKPGQFVKIFFPGSEKEFRMFSIASPPGEADLEFCIKILPDGKFSQLIDKMKMGETLTLEGPFGHFVYEDADNCAFVAAGTGIAPVLSMLRYIAHTQKPGNFTLLYTNKTRNSILYYDELKRLQQQHSGFNIIFTLTQEVPENWDGETGRINPDMVNKHIPDPAARFWYFCGPVEFVKTIKDYTLNHGVHPQRIKMEGWG